MSRHFWVMVSVGVIAATAIDAAQTTQGAAGQSANGQTTTQAPDRGGARGQRPGSPLTVNPNAALRDVQSMLNNMVLVEAQNRLQLSDSQWVAFLPKMRELQRLRMQHQERRLALIQQIRRATQPDSNVDEATLSTYSKDLDELETKMETDQRAALAGVDSVLTAYQRARFRVFEEDMERKKLELLAKVLNNAPGGAPPAPAAAPGTTDKPRNGRGK